MSQAAQLIIVELLIQKCWVVLLMCPHLVLFYDTVATYTVLENSTEFLRFSSSIFVSTVV
jgi:hypothetical protein